MEPNIINVEIRKLPMQPGIDCEFMAVLVLHAEGLADVIRKAGRGGNGNYTVLLGLVKPGSHRTRASRLKAAQWVTSFGRKCSYREAIVYFPAIKEEAYSP